MINKLKDSIMGRKKFAFALILSLCIFSGSNAQERFVRGVVTTYETMPLIGAKVTVKSSNTEVFTDTAGMFTVVCDPKDVLKVTADGFFNQRVKIEPDIKYAAVNLKLKPGEKNYSLGYGYVSDRDKLYALAGLDKDDMDLSEYSSLLEAISGRFAGVQVTRNGDIIIRGLNSINGNSSALIVVDGMITDNSVLTQLSPSHVKRIDVIKDGGAALYGSRGGSGVLLIETKSGVD